MRLYLQCQGMKWNHLPVMGGIYDQHPKMLDDFLIIDNIRSQAIARQRAQQQRQARRK